jgi:flagellar biosynthesis chaperone FliJ
MKQEEIKRSELVAITEQIGALRAGIMLEKAALRRKLAEFRDRHDDSQLTDQQLFLQHIHVFDGKIATLEQNLRKLEDIRRTKTAEILELRKTRKGLEKLREKAKTEFVREQEKIEQDLLDDNTTMRFAAKILHHT